MANKPKQRRAYSYIRFSSKDQEKGDSLRRQVELRDKILLQHPEWLLDETSIQDLGVSAWEGTNIIDGALGVFIAACEAGKIPRGSILIIERWDRLSRLPAVEAMELFSRITRRGVDICTAADGKIHNRESMKDIGNLLESIIKMQLANEESSKKSDRVKTAWGKKRANDKVITKRCPGWLTWNDTTFELIPKRAKVVKEIFKWTAMGKGLLLICNELNKRKEPTWGKGNVGGWWPCYISSILHNQAVIGRFQPCKTARNERGKTIRVPDGEPREGYFPRAIDDALWQRVQTKLSGSKKCNGAMAGAGRPGSFPIRNLFSGILYDGIHPRSRMVLSNGSVYFISDWNRLNPGSGIITWNVADLEHLVFSFLQGLDYEALSEQNITATKEEKLLATTQTKLDSINTRVEQLLDTLETCVDVQQREIIAKRVGERAREKAELETQVKELKAAHDAVKAASGILGDAHKEMCKFLNSNDMDTRLRLRVEVRRIVKRIDLFPDGASDEELKDEPVKAPGWPAIKITFVNARIRWIFSTSKKPIANDSVALLDTAIQSHEPSSKDAADVPITEKEVAEALRDENEPIEEPKIPS